MDPPLFVNHYSPLIRAMRTCGLATPWIEKPSSLLPRIPFLIWDTLLVAIVVYMLFIYVHTVTTIYVPMQDLCGLGISSTSFITGLLLTVYHILFGRRLRAITAHMDRIVGSIHLTRLANVEIHQRMYITNAKYAKLLIMIFFRFSTFLPFLYTLVVPVSDFLSGEYRSKFYSVINSPFDDRQPGLYEFTVCISSTCVISSYAKKTATDCLFMALFRIQTDFLKYLSVTMTSLQKEFLTGSRELAMSKLALWVKLHQDVVKNVQELIFIFSPVIIIYYLCVIGNIVLGAFILIKKDNDSIFQSALVSVYMVVSLAYQFLICDTAQQLSLEANKLAEAAYSTPWYDMMKTDAEAIRLVVQIANRPIEVTAYRAPRFLLNRETCAGFIATVLSSFVTLCQMKDNYDQ